MPKYLTKFTQCRDELGSVEILNNKHIFNGDYPDHVLLRNTYTMHKLLYVDHQYSSINNNKTSRAFTH